MEPNKDNPMPVNPPAENPLPQGTPLPTPAPTPAPTSSTPGSAQVTQAPKGSSKTMMMAVIVVLILAILGVGGYILYQSQMGSQESGPSTDTSATNKQMEQINEEVKSIEVTDPNAEFIEIDKEITALEATPSGAASSSANTR